MATTRKTLLFIVQRAPYGSSTARETLDAALAAAAFEQHVQLLFSGDGVWHLLPGQHAEAIASKDTARMLQALDYYDINEIYVDSASLEERALTTAALALPVTIANTDRLRVLLRAADNVVML